MSGPELRKIRSQLGLTQQQLAQKIGYHFNSVSAWETSKRPMPRVVDLAVRQLRAQAKGSP